MKRLLKIAAIAVAVIVVILIAIPFFINVNSFRPKLEAAASEALGRQVKVGNLSLSILTGAVTADDISIADDPAFASAPFVTAKSLKVGVELMPLIFSKQLHVTGITLDQPEITMLKTANGKWNFSSLGGNATKKSSQPATDSTPTDLSVAKLSVNDGKLIVGKANSKAKPHVYDQVNITVTDFSPTSQFPFKLTANEVAIGLTMPHSATAILRQRLSPSAFNRAVRAPSPAMPCAWNAAIVSTIMAIA